MPVPGHAVLHPCELRSACHRRFCRPSWQHRSAVGVRTLSAAP
jgi:hypothetical protein